MCVDAEREDWGSRVRSVHVSMRGVVTDAGMAFGVRAHATCHVSDLCDEGLIFS